MLDYPAWKNGEYCQVKDLTVSILDLGLIHSDATYDVIAIKNGRIENYERHIDRFFRSCFGWKIPIKYSSEEIKHIIQTLISKTATKDLLAWIAITRGVPKSGNPRDLVSCEPNLFVYVKPYFAFNKTNTATVCLAKQKRVTEIDQTMKNFSWNDLNMAQWEAINRGYDTAILIDSRGYITEGPGFNVGFVSRDEIVYAPKYNRLNGTVMETVKDLCEGSNVQFIYTDISVSDIDDMVGMFLTSTAGNVIKVNRFENTYFIENKIVEWLQSFFH